MLCYAYIARVDKHATKLLDLELNRSVYPVSNLRGPKLLKEYLNVRAGPCDRVV
jgi:hypothetical protein